MRNKHPYIASLLNIWLLLMVLLKGCRKTKCCGTQFYADANWIVFALSLSYLLQIVHCVSVAEIIPTQRRDYEDRLCLAASQPDKIQHDLCVLLIAMAILKL